MTLLSIACATSKRHIVFFGGNLNKRYATGDPRANQLTNNLVLWWTNYVWGHGNE